MDDVKVRTRTGAFRAYIRSLVNKQLRRHWFRSDFGLSYDNPIIHGHGILRLPVCQHRYLSHRRPEQGRKVDRPSQCDLSKSTMLLSVHRQSFPAAAFLTTNWCSVVSRRGGYFWRAPARYHT